MSNPREGFVKHVVVSPLLEAGVRYNAVTLQPDDDGTLVPHETHCRVDWQVFRKMPDGYTWVSQSETFSSEHEAKKFSLSL